MRARSKTKIFNAGEVSSAAWRSAHGPWEGQNDAPDVGVFTPPPMRVEPVVCDAMSRCHSFVARSNGVARGLFGEPAHRTLEHAGSASSCVCMGRDTLAC